MQHSDTWLDFFLSDYFATLGQQEARLATGRPAGYALSDMQSFSADGSGAYGGANSYSMGLHEIQQNIYKHYAWVCSAIYPGSVCLVTLLATACTHCSSIRSRAVLCLYGPSSCGQGAQMRDDPGVLGWQQLLVFALGTVGHMRGSSFGSLVPWRGLLPVPMRLAGRPCRGFACI